MSTLWIACALLLAPTVRDLERAIGEHVRSERYGAALRAIDELLAAAPSSEVPESRRVELEKLRARCQFELGDYPMCERTLRGLQTRLEPGSEDGDWCRAQIARVASLQGAHATALQEISNAIEARPSPALHRAAIAIALRAQRYELAWPHTESILGTQPGDRYARFVQGLVLSRRGEYTRAVEALAAGVDLDGAWRDARFELALALAKLHDHRRALGHLAEVLERDPYDAEACYQASRALLRLGGRRRAAAAASLLRYFELLSDSADPSSRDVHLAAAGRGDEAAALRASRSERLGDLEGALRELDRAVALWPQSAGVRVARAGFWLRAGLLREAANELRALRPEAKSSPAVRELGEAIDGAEKELSSQTGTPLGAARSRLAGALWTESGKHLEEILEIAKREGSDPLADGAARLVLARDPSSVPALAHLAARTASPALIVPHVHFLSRLARATRDDPRTVERLIAVRLELRGDADE